jgi:hypothetical protein
MDGSDRRARGELVGGGASGVNDKQGEHKRDTRENAVAHL